jgi:hypothetical protein
MGDSARFIDTGEHLEAFADEFRFSVPAVPMYALSPSIQQRPTHPILSFHQEKLPALLVVFQKNGQALQ